ncbi:hypothetical protein FDB28_10450 [Clostridium botulinum]|uniref:hypothetical protein n=1 Tax=Clostridium botulinum TaxID=1491 RepID=UPI0013F80F75|nr:hypothetical protein [Clostridium botulinum]MBY6916005.1 hypothetical protein [Clostridium botulinum]NFN94501.1 hypothetical protein [Clostridium botulinum]NFQ40186.1 hypothetical protein [Clostridium botulinum]NFS96494.1 hypothetical protein [Clostridium botulinum]
MLSKNSLIVWEYLKKYFKTNSKPITPLEVSIPELSIEEINIAFSELNNTGKIVLNTNYIHHCVENISE